MPPTTLKLPPELKRRIQAVVDGTGQSVHAFIAAALAARTEFDRTGIGYAAADVHAHFRARVAGRKSARPKSVRWRR
jgi:predicted transcriptional regulator